MNLGKLICKNMLFHVLFGLWAIIFVSINYQFSDENCLTVSSISSNTESSTYSESVLVNGNRTDYFLQRRPQTSPVRIENTQLFPTSSANIFSKNFDYSFIAEIFSSQIQVIFARNYTVFRVKKRYLTFCTFRL